MKIALIGASGFVGRNLLSEAVSRGHSVTAIVRNPEKLEHADAVSAVRADVNDAEALSGLLGRHDVVISAFNGGWGDADIYTKHLAGSRAIARAAKTAGVRLIMIGGAGSLYAPDGSQFVDSPAFPVEWKEGARAARDALGELRAEQTLDWTSSRRLSSWRRASAPENTGSAATCPCSTSTETAPSQSLISPSRCLTRRKRRSIRALA